MIFFKFLLVFGLFVCEIKCLTKKEATEYLHHYRHLKSDRPSPNEYTEGLKDFQRYAQIPITGVLDGDTKEMMKTPRCFNPNEGVEDVENRVRRYVLHDAKWNRNKLSYNMKYPNNIDRSVIMEGMKKAFDTWSRYSGIQFTETGRFNAHIKMEFNRIDRMTTLGYAYYPHPTRGGGIVFSNRHTWTNDPKQHHYTFYQVALHEIGHSLGLEHSDIKNAIMYPFASRENGEIHSDDIAGIQALYK